MDRTRAAHMIPRDRAWLGADEVHEVGRSDPTLDFDQVNARAGGGSQGRVIRGQSLSGLGVWAHVGDRAEMRNPDQSP